MTFNGIFGIIIIENEKGEKKIMSRELIIKVDSACVFTECVSNPFVGACYDELRTDEGTLTHADLVAVKENLKLRKENAENSLALAEGWLVKTTDYEDYCAAFETVKELKEQVADIDAAVVAVRLFDSMIENVRWSDDDNAATHTITYIKSY